MTKLADASTSVSGGDNSPGGGSCFADVLVPGEFYYRNSWWAGKFEYPDNVKWEDKKDVLYWRGKSNGGHIRGTNYRSFPRFRLMDLAALPENRAKGLFDVRITQWHESHCTDDCDADAIRNAYKITGESVPREEAYQYKYLLDVDGNTFSGRYLGLLRSGGLVFKSTAFAEFFTPWLVPYEHFIPVRPDLADLPAKIEWARANDGEARRIQESGRVFAERVLTDA
ncbi:glycosyl transferase family 90-domain-containing protein, partial [Mycena leptocephala]